jgi:8-oxo-dGTP pyrophosphatase MutT (NUDIX family)
MRYVADVLECAKCGEIRIKNVIKHPWSAVLQPAIGVFAGIFDSNGRILLVKIDYGQFVGEWNLPGGGVDAEKAKEAIDEQFLLQELAREVEEETGISLHLKIEENPILWPALLKGGEDLALPIVVGVIKDQPTKGETRFASLETVQKLAKQLPRSCLLGGYGGRMHRMTLRLLSYSHNRSYQQEARNALKILQEKVI